MTTELKNKIDNEISVFENIVKTCDISAINEIENSKDFLGTIEILIKLSTKRTEATSKINVLQNYKKILTTSQN